MRGCPLPSRTKGEGGDPLFHVKLGGGVPLTPLPLFAAPGIPAPSEVPREIQENVLETWRGVPPRSRTQGEGGDPLFLIKLGGGVPPTPPPFWFFRSTGSRPFPRTSPNSKKRAQAPAAAGTVTFAVLLPATDVAMDAGMTAWT